MVKTDYLWQCIDPEIDGIFERLDTLGVPWSEDISPSTLDDVYLGTYSGGKPPAPIVKRWALYNDARLTSDQMNRLASMIHSMNISDWARLWSAEVSQYNPISNYDMVEELSNDIREREENNEDTTTYGKTSTRTVNLTDGYGNSVTRTDDLTDGYGGTVTRTDNLTDGHGESITRTDNLTNTHTGTDTSESAKTTNTDNESTHSVFGLNSLDAVPSDTDTSEATTTDSEEGTVTYNTTDTQGGTVTTAHSGSDTHTGTQATAHTGSDTHTGTQTTARSGSDTHTGTDTDALSGTDETAGTRSATETHSYTLTRSGNIGVTTAQDMLTQERVLRAWRLFYDRVFPDVDRVLTLATY